jgi:alpha-1,2-mannosyltransferase
MAAMPSRRVLAAACLAVVLVVAYRVRISSGMADFAVFYRAGQRLQSGERLYQPADGHYVFKYLPASAMVFLPLAPLPLAVAKPVWFAISLAALAWAFTLVGRLVPLPHVRYLLLISGLVLAKYFLHELRLGQINIVVMTVMLLATRALARDPEMRHDAAAGALAGVATALKPYAAVFIPYFVITRNWAAAASGVAVIAIALVATVPFYGVHGSVQALQDWVTTLSQSTPGLLTNSDNVSVSAFFAKWLGPSTAAVAASAVVLALLAVLMLAVVLRGRASRTRVVLECAMLLTLIPLVSPMGWDYTFLLSLLGIAVIVNAFAMFPRAARIAIAIDLAMIALAVFDIMGRRAYSLFMAWSVTTVNCPFVLLALALLRFRSEL